MATVRDFFLSDPMEVGGEVLGLALSTVVGPVVHAGFSKVIGNKLGADATNALVNVAVGAAAGYAGNYFGVERRYGPLAKGAVEGIQLGAFASAAKPLTDWGVSQVKGIFGLTAGYSPVMGYVDVQPTYQYAARSLDF